MRLNYLVSGIVSGAGDRGSLAQDRWRRRNCGFPQGIQQHGRVNRGRCVWTARRRCVPK